jgi:non-specific serine/threonine protein kinase
MRLTRRQSEVAELIGRGLTNREIARALHISERTVEGHVLQLMNLMGARSRAQVAVWWVRRSETETPVSPLEAVRVSLLVCELCPDAAAPLADEATGRRFDEIWTEEVRRRGGRNVPREATLGRRLAVFTGGSAAVSAALGVRAAADIEPWPGGRALRSRALIHLADGRRTGGPDPKATAACVRLMAEARPGQVLVSEAATLALGGDLALRAALRELATGDGGRSAQLGRLYELMESGGHGGPASPEDRPRTNLRLALSTFVNRQRELAELRELERQHRLICLAGVGGCGKTRLASRLAASLLDTYPDGAWLAELDAIEDPLLVPQAVASVLGVREQRGRPLQETLVEGLADRRALLLLDNAEHVVGAVADLTSAILSRCSGVQVLVTSREPVGLPGEVTYRVPTLPYPDFATVPGLSAADGYSAVKLFVERAREHDPAFRLTDRNVSTVCQICARLDGLPLAIELAAAWVPFMTVDQILGRLDDRFHLLAGGPRTAPARHETMAAAIDWSYEQLDEPERRLFRQLSVFVGSFALPDLEAVCFDGGDGREPLDLLRRLATKSLVLIEGGRIRCLETIREYGRRQLAREGSLDETTRRHARHFAQVVLDDRRIRDGAGWRERLDRCLPNVRAALAWALEHDTGLAAELAPPLWEYWQLRGHIAEARQALEALVAAAPGPPPVHFQALTVAALIAYQQNDLRSGTAWADEALAIGREHVPEALWAPLRARGYLAMAADELAAAQGYLEEAVAASRGPGRPAAEAAQALHDLAIITGLRGGLSEAVALFERSLELRASLGAPDEGHVSLAFLALTHLLMGDLAAARASVRDGLEAARRLRDRRAAWSVEIAACIAAASGDARRALRLAGAGAALHQAAGTAPFAAWPRLTGTWLGPARTALPPGEAAEAEAAGRRLGFAEALDLALGS